MGTILKFPPCIKHVGQRPEQEAQSLVVDQALANLRAPRAACKLMRFYTDNASGFRPSLKMITDATGLDKNNVSRTRALLIAYGLLGYDGKTVYVDWVRLRAFAAINAKLMGQKKQWKITPVSPDLLAPSKNDVYNYLGTDERSLLRVYEATAEAVAAGVKFPELRGTEVEKLLGDPKNDVYNYLGTGELVYGSCGWQEIGWYNPFDEPIPAWAVDIPALPF